MIYVFSLEKVESGGPELLHQLVYVLNVVGVPAKIVYLSQYMPFHIVEAQPVDAYEKYNVVSEARWEEIDKKENVIIFPELAYDFLEKTSYATKVAWWLSVDGYIEAVKVQHNRSDKDMGAIENLDFYDFRRREDVFHLCQSYYAMDFLKNRLGVREEFVDYLSDYLNDIYLEGVICEASERRDMVLFNPAKGGSRLKTLIDATRDEILWYPLVNMTRERMRAAMNLAKVYVDFGEHPGKDRIPREAAISGCCVLTGRRGAAAYAQDIPIPDKYKFDDSLGVDVESVKKQILDIFRNYEERLADFESYRQMIRSEKERFVGDVIRLFR